MPVAACITPCTASHFVYYIVRYIMLITSCTASCAGLHRAPQRAPRRALSHRALHQALATAKTAASEAQQAGLFESANFKAFNSSLVHIINDVKGEVSNVQGGTTTASQAVLNALAFKPNAPDAGFIFM